MFVGLKEFDSQSAYSLSLPACDLIKLSSHLSGMLCRSAPAETNPFRDASGEAGAKDRRREEQRSNERGKREEGNPKDANMPISNGLQGSGGSFTFNDKLLAPASAAGPQRPAAGQCLSLPNASAGEPQAHPKL